MALVKNTTDTIKNLG